MCFKYNIISFKTGKTLKSLFNFVKNNVIPDLSNSCDSAVLAKTFRAAKLSPWKIPERDTVDEFIFKTENSRNRLMLELMARGEWESVKF